MRTCRGALHVHSTYSDGEFTLAELRDVYRAAGCAFACVTDHAEYFDGDRLEAYAAECAALSDGRFRLLPGLEYNCERKMHILGYGVTALPWAAAPEEVIGGIAARGGVSVIAHPRDADFPWIETFDRLPCGIETWNSKYDGRYAPRPGTFGLLRRLQAREPSLRAFYGQDLHWRRQFRGLFVTVRCQSPGRDAILAALAAGDFWGVKGNLRLPSSGELSAGLLARFAALHRCSDGLRRLMKGAKKLMDRCGARVPSPVKAQLRRLF
jgi:predicted metal-dependent phosphoesterase TrpH